MSEANAGATKLKLWVLIGAVVEVPAVLLAIASGGAGHGHYVAARALFPVPMLLTSLEGEIGPFTGAMTLLQFPIYGAMIAWIIGRRSYTAGFLLAAVHLTAAVACFSGTIPGFS